MRGHLDYNTQSLWDYPKVSVWARRLFADLNSSPNTQGALAPMVVKVIFLLAVPKPCRCSLKITSPPTPGRCSLAMCAGHRDFGFCAGSRTSALGWSSQLSGVPTRIKVPLELKLDFIPFISSCLEQQCHYPGLECHYVDWSMLFLYWLIKRHYLVCYSLVKLL